MAVDQFRDLPQIHYMDEQRFAMWPSEFYDGYSQKSHVVDSNLERDISFDGFDNGIMNLHPAQPMQRFMFDQSPLSYGVLHAGIPLSDPYGGHHIQQWPLADCYRNSSPDRTSTSGTSSYAAQNELYSPHALGALPYDSPTDYTQMTHTNTTFEYSEDAVHLSGASSFCGSITLRQLEYNHQEPEHVIEEIETVSLKLEPVPEPEPVVVKTETVSVDYKEYSDSGIGNSARDAESVQPVDFPEEPASDSDYRPRPSRANKRKRSSAVTATSSRAQKRRGYNRKDSTASPPVPNKQTKRHRGPQTPTTTEAHRYTDDTRPFPCPLAAYSCTATFASKNEWKRHVSTQHIKLGFWRCDLCKPTTDPNDPQACYYNDFNRKDLFTQHLRRMHAAPLTGTRSANATQSLVTDDNIADHQARCYTQLRDAPQQSKCLFCERAFSGPASWDERMEHVGRHLEKYRKCEVEVAGVASWNGDKALQEYLVEEGLIVQGKFGWKIGDGKARRMDVVESEEFEESEEE
jgi:hypothetical protein